MSFIVGSAFFNPGMIFPAKALTNILRLVDQSIHKHIIIDLRLVMY